MVARYFDYGVNADGTRYTQEFVGTAGPSSPRWTKSTIDWADRLIRTERPSFTTTNVIESSTYNTQGQLQQVTTMAGTLRLIANKLFEYDEVGNQTRAGLDVDGNGALTLSSTDRINEIETVYEKVGSDWFRRVTRKLTLQTIAALQRSVFSGSD